MRVEHSIEIKRPVEQVFAYVTAPEHWPEWAGPVIAVRRASPGPLAAGAEFTQVVKFLGQQIESPCHVIVYEPSRRLVYRATSGPARGESTMLFEPVEGGTRYTQIMEGEPGGLVKRFAGPMVRSAAQRQVVADLETLKAVLEGQGPATEGRRG